MMTEPTGADYQALLARIESGDVRSVPGSLRRGEEAAQAGRALLMEATQTDTIDDAITVALGRPRKTAVPTTVIKAAMPEPMVVRVRTLARRQKVSTAQVVRTAMAEYLEKMAY